MVHIQQRKMVRKASDIFLGIAFLALIFLPMCVMVLPANRAGVLPDNAEKMPVSPLQYYRRNVWLKPIVELYDGTQTFLYRFKNTFILRETFVRWHGEAKVNWFKTSSSRDVVLGKQGWLFYTGDESIQDFRHLYPSSPKQLESMRAIFQEMHDRLATRGIKFLVVVAPDKHSIYPEFMPDTLRQLKGQSRLDQLAQIMKKQSLINFLDLRPTLLDARKSRLVYHANDTHWNDYGSFAAYQATATRLKAWYPQLKIASLQDYKVETIWRKGGDLTRLLGLRKETPTRYQSLRAISKNRIATEQKIQPPSLNDSFQSGILTRSRNGEIPRAIFFGDSFSDTKLRPFLAQHFKEGHWYRFGQRRTIYFDLVDRIKPDLVIFETAQRQLTQTKIEAAPKS